MGSVREADAGDVNSIYELIVDLEQTSIDKEHFQKVFSYNLSIQGVYYFVYEDKGEILGFVSLHIQRLLHHAASVGEIQEIIVDKRKRGSGIGKILYEKVVEVSVQQGCQQLEVCCHQMNASGRSFYASQGMTNNHYKYCLKL